MRRKHRTKTAAKSSASVLFPAWPLGLGLGVFFTIGELRGAVRVLHKERLACIETTENVILEGNHPSWADPFLVTAMLAKYYGWHPLKCSPVIFADMVKFCNSPWFYAFKSVMIPVYRGEDNIEKLASAKRILQAFADYPGRPKILFPEGGRTVSGEIINKGNGKFFYGRHGEQTKIRHFAEGVGSLVRTTEATVIPIGMIGNDRAFPYSEHRLLTWPKFGEKVTISVGNPHKFSRKDSKETITLEISSEVLEQMDEAYAFHKANP